MTEVCTCSSSRGKWAVCDHCVAEARRDYAAVRRIVSSWVDPWWIRYVAPVVGLWIAVSLGLAVEFVWTPIAYRLEIRARARQNR